MAYIRSEAREPNPNKALWRHVFFIERILQCIALRLYDSPDSFRHDFQQFAGKGDMEFLNNNCRHLAEVKAEEVSE